VKLLFLLLVLTGPAWAEVMDKEPTLSEIWWSGAMSAAFAWLLGRRSPWLGWLALIPLGPALGALLECYDRFVGPAILHEAGSGYVVQAHLAVTFPLLAFLVGLGSRPGRIEVGFEVEGIRGR